MRCHLIYMINSLLAVEEKAATEQEEKVQAVKDWETGTLYRKMATPTSSFAKLVAEDCKCEICHESFRTDCSLLMSADAYKPEYSLSILKCPHVGCDAHFSAQCLIAMSLGVERFNTTLVEDRLRLHTHREIEQKIEETQNSIWLLYDEMHGHESVKRALTWDYKTDNLLALTQHKIFELRQELKKVTKGGNSRTKFEINADIKDAEIKFTSLEEEKKKHTEMQKYRPYEDIVKDLSEARERLISLKEDKEKLEETQKRLLILYIDEKKIKKAKQNIRILLKLKKALRRKKRMALLKTATLMTVNILQKYIQSLYKEKMTNREGQISADTYRLEMQLEKVKQILFNKNENSINHKRFNKILVKIQKALSEISKNKRISEGAQHTNTSINGEEKQVASIKKMLLDRYEQKKKADEAKEKKEMIMKRKKEIEKQMEINKQIKKEIKQEVEMDTEEQMENDEQIKKEIKQEVEVYMNEHMKNDKQPKREIKQEVEMDTEEQMENDKQPKIEIKQEVEMDMDEQIEEIKPAKKDIDKQIEIEWEVEMEKAMEKEIKKQMKENKQMKMEMEKKNQKKKLKTTMEDIMKLLAKNDTEGDFLGDPKQQLIPLGKVKEMLEKDQLKLPRPDEIEEDLKNAKKSYILLLKEKKICERDQDYERITTINIQLEDAWLRLTVIYENMERLEKNQIMLKILQEKIYDQNLLLIDQMRDERDPELNEKYTIHCPKCCQPFTFNPNEFLAYSVWSFALNKTNLIDLSGYLKNNVYVFSSLLKYYFLDDMLYESIRKFDVPEFGDIMPFFLLALSIKEESLSALEFVIQLNVYLDTCNNISEQKVYWLLDAVCSFFLEYNKDRSDIKIQLVENLLTYIGICNYTYEYFVDKILEEPDNSNDALALFNRLDGKVLSSLFKKCTQNIISHVNFPKPDVILNLWKNKVEYNIWLDDAKDASSENYQFSDQYEKPIVSEFIADYFLKMTDRDQALELIEEVFKIHIKHIFSKSNEISYKKTIVPRNMHIIKEYIQDLLEAQNKGANLIPLKQILENKKKILNEWFSWDFSLARLVRKLRCCGPSLMNTLVSYVFEHELRTPSNVTYLFLTELIDQQHLIFLTTLIQVLKKLGKIPEKFDEAFILLLRHFKINEEDMKLVLYFNEIIGHKRLGEVLRRALENSEFLSVNNVHVVIPFVFEEYNELVDNLYVAMGRSIGMYGALEAKTRRTILENMRKNGDYAKYGLIAFSLSEDAILALEKNAILEILKLKWIRYNFDKAVYYWAAHGIPPFLHRHFPLIFKAVHPKFKKNPSLMSNFLQYFFKESGVLTKSEKAKYKELLMEENSYPFA
ncbi:hypothetical protein ENBRE01_2658 [Enteropsectra breve]|nr:hypothetical protein ENBRE01_2658 [Enteropsectra breve]